MASTLIDKVRLTIRKYSMFSRYDRVLIGLSGGPDSVALLYVLFALRNEYSFGLYIGHLDHRFRGEASAEDRRFCQELARKLSIDIVCEEVDVPRIVEEKRISAEEAARQVRYDFFKRVAREKGADKIAVGHTKDDQAETVLMRMVRGAGIVGLSGMKPVNIVGGFTIVRPMIEISKSEIEDFIKQKKLSFRYDSSNDELMYTRNRVRQVLLPYLEKEFNPNIKEVLANMAENIRVENEFIERYGKRKFKSMTRRHKDGELWIDIKRLKSQDEAIQKRILRCALENVKGNLRRLTYRHWKEIEELIKNRPSNSIVDLPDGINIIKKKDILVIQR